MNLHINIVYEFTSVCVCILKPNAQVLPDPLLEVNPIFPLS